ncbi:BspA family leucine-rich repeat surface protein [Campylobacter sp. P0109]|uniref:BspA family leucine-rich repeat surface protein n=1 Tax=Campylobacter sp. P0109 TaxID=1895606 RepID=UPI000A335765|nr:BspA family leucine-rich repeat surface protein [Campylobacter sp. P0109]
MPNYEKRIKETIETLKSGLFEREECLKLVLLSMFAGKSIFLYGPPGTAKSMIARRASLAFKITDNSQDESKESNNGFFAYLMNRFSTPEEIFGPIDIAELKKNNLTRKTDGYLPTAHFAFLDEIWKSSPAILNTLLTIINERIYRDGNKDIKVPLKGVVCASNEFPPDNQGLEALYDRMILRYFVKPLEERENFKKLFKSKKSNDIKPLEPFSISELEQIAIKSQDIKFEQDTMDLICDLKSQIQLLNQDKEYRKEFLSSDEYKPIYISDRRWKQCAELLQTAALLSDRDRVERYDLALLAHLLWSSEEDKVIIEKILFNVLNENSNFDSELKALKEDNLNLKNLIEKNLYSPNGKPKKVDNNDKNKYLQISKDQITKANNLKNNIEAEFQKAKASIKNPFLSQNDIELSLSSYTLPLKEANNEILKAKELENIVENQPVNEKLKKASSAEYKYHPETNEELRELVSHESVKLSEIDISKVSDLSELFKDSQRSDFSGIEEWDVSHVTNMSGMFQSATSFNQPLNDWDVSHVTNMSGMFQSATSFNQPLNDWDVSNVTNMSYMFADAVNFNSDISSWDVSHVTDMSSMFASAFNFNQPLNDWNVSHVTNMSHMFYRAISFNQPLNNWDVSSVTNMSGMFAIRYEMNYRYIDYTPDIFTNYQIYGIFNYDNETPTIFNQPLNNWDVSSVTNMEGMFLGNESFNQLLNDWNVSNVKNIRGMFFKAKSFNQPLVSWKISIDENKFKVLAFYGSAQNPLPRWYEQKQ